MKFDDFQVRDISNPVNNRRFIESCVTHRQNNAINKCIPPTETHKPIASELCGWSHQYLGY